jgi:hypothetical protein
MKVTIQRDTAGAKLAHLVPPAYRDGVADAARPEGRYSLLLFAHAPRDVVPSAPVIRGLRRLGAPAADGIVAGGTGCTAEALAALADAGARVVAVRTARWTDESARLRQL